MRSEPEQYPDYRDYYDGDMWPSIERGGVLEETWVGDMAPQHCAASCYKLKRWCFEQWATEIGGEKEWHTARQSMLYHHLAAKATASDFVEAVLVTPEVHYLDLKAMGNLMMGCLMVSDEVEGLNEAHARRLGLDLADSLYTHRYRITRIKS